MLRLSKNIYSYKINPFYLFPIILLFYSIFTILVLNFNNYESLLFIFPGDWDALWMTILSKSNSLYYGQTILAPYPFGYLTKYIELKFQLGIPFTILVFSLILNFKIIFLNRIFIFFYKDHAFTLTIFFFLSFHSIFFLFNFYKESFLILSIIMMIYIYCKIFSLKINSLKDLIIIVIQYLIIFLIIIFSRKHASYFIILSTFIFTSVFYIYLILEKKKKYIYEIISTIIFGFISLVILINFTISYVYIIPNSLGVDNNLYVNKIKLDKFPLFLTDHYNLKIINKDKKPGRTAVNDFSNKLNNLTNKNNKNNNTQINITDLLDEQVSKQNSATKDEITKNSITKTKRLQNKSNLNKILDMFQPNIKYALGSNLNFFLKFILLLESLLSNILFIFLVILIFFINFKNKLYFISIVLFLLISSYICSILNENIGTLIRHKLVFWRLINSFGLMSLIYVINYYFSNRFKKYEK